MALGLQSMIFAGGLTALSNYFFRKTIDTVGSSRGFLLIQLTCTFLVMIFLHPIRSQNFGFSFEIALLGILSGGILGFMMLSLGKALEKGPIGLTMAFLNASTVFPILGMVALFGKEFGFEYTFWNGLGSIILIMALFWAGCQFRQTQNTEWWLFFAISAFVLHIFLLLLFQWHSLLLRFPGELPLFGTFSTKNIESEWFMPIVFFTASAMQWILHLKKGAFAILKKEFHFGLLGGLANGMGTFFMIYGTEVATSIEQAMIFPVFTVTTLLICNIWGRLLYKETVHWRAMLTCVAGTIIGSVNWALIR